MVVVDHWMENPDLVTMAKGLTSAYAPLGAIVELAFQLRDFNG